GWLLPVNFSGIIAIGLMLGVAGSSFAVALPLASHWYPSSRQGLIMGITAAGNIGTVVANLFAPPLAKAYGWHAVMGMAMLPLAAASPIQSAVSACLQSCCWALEPSISWPRFCLPSV